MEKQYRYLEEALADKGIKVGERFLVINTRDEFIQCFFKNGQLRHSMGYVVPRSTEDCILYGLYRIGKLTRQP